MGQRGVHATINKDETTGRFIVHLTTVHPVVMGCT